MNTPTANLRLCLHKLQHPGPVGEKLCHDLVCHLCLGSTCGWRPSWWCRHTIYISRRGSGAGGVKGEAGIENRVMYFEEDDLDEVAHTTSRYRLLARSLHNSSLTAAVHFVELATTYNHEGPTYIGNECWRDKSD
jgi:hypothetical protein